MNNIVFRKYDIRGIVDKEIDESFSYLLGQALTTYMRLKGRKKKITVGHDVRLSSHKLYKSLIAGLTEHGAHVIKLGPITTPLSYYSTYMIDDIAMSAMITGSHNPPEYNGFKLTFNRCSLSSEDIQKIYGIMLAKEFSKTSGRNTSFDIVTKYVDQYAEQFKHLKNIPVVMDCGNGTAGIVLRKLMNKIGLNFEILFETPDGNFPNHHPDPTIKENLEDLAKKVIQTKSIVGIGFDGDADRIGVVDEKGQFILGDELLYIFAKAILKTNPSASIVADVKCSDKLYNAINSMGGKTIMWKTGHSLIKQKIKEKNALLGGELSGHICFRDKNYGYDDAIYASLRLLEILIQSNAPLSKLLTDLPKSYCTPEIRINTSEDKKGKLMKKIKDIFKNDTAEYKVNHIDGVRISFEDGWALIRDSNTQPVIVLRFESKTSSGLLRIRNKIEPLLKEL